MGDFINACSLRNVAVNFVWAFTGIYGPNVDCDTGLLSDELVWLLSRWNLPWCSAVTSTTSISFDF